MLRNRVSSLSCLALAFLLTGSAAQAGFVFFTVNPGNANEVALVGEQIYAIGGGFDYEFLVDNIGTVGINGFYGGIGNLAAAIAGGQWVGTAAGGAAAPFPASAVGGAFGPLITNAFGATNPFSAVPTNTWGFEEFNAGGVGLPASYVVRWFNTGLTGPLPPGFFTRFDLISPFGPSPGGGGVDPMGDAFLGFEDVLSGNFMLDTNSTTVGTCNPATDLNCSATAIPSQFNGANSFGAPEPGTWLTVCGGLLALAGFRRKAG